MAHTEIKFSQQGSGRHRLFVRAASMAGAAGLVIVALWSAGVPPAELWTRAEQWLGGVRGSLVPTATQSPPEALVPVPVAAPVEQAPLAESLAGTDSSISTTPQPLYLLATSPGRHVSEGTALIGTSIDNPQTYSAGALLANGAQLAEIYRDYVVLQRADQSARLPLYQRSKFAAQRSELNDLLTVGGEPPAQPVAAVRRKSLTDYLRPSPVYDGEMLTGYQVYPGQKVGVFAQLGLQPGDVITAINDAPFADPAQAIQMLELIFEGVAVVATVVRSNKTERITMDGAVIAADQEGKRNADVVALPAGMLPTS